MKANIFTDWNKIETIINKCESCTIAMVDENNMPYVLPFNFGYENKTIYFHGAKVGKKVDILKNNNNVCIAFNTDSKMNIQNENVACSYSMRYRSVLANGKVEIIEDFDEKIRILNVIMKKYTQRDDFSYGNPSVNNVAIFKVVIDSISGKEYGY